MTHTRYHNWACMRDELIRATSSSGDYADREYKSFFQTPLLHLDWHVF